MYSDTKHFLKYYSMQEEQRRHLHQVPGTKVCSVPKLIHDSNPFYSCLSSIQAGLGYFKTIIGQKCQVLMQWQIIKLSTRQAILQLSDMQNQNIFNKIFGSFSQNLQFSECFWKCTKISDNSFSKYINGITSLSLYQMTCQNTKSLAQT